MYEERLLVTCVCKIQLGQDSCSYSLIKWRLFSFSLRCITIRGNSFIGSTHKCVTELETICINRMCIAMGMGGRQQLLLTI
jgi:hypothetical protein